MTATTADALAWSSVRILGKHRAAKDIFVFEFGGEAPLPAVSPGAHVEVKINALSRHYSLCGTSHDGARYRIAVHRAGAGRGGSTALCDTVEVGDVLPLRGPFNHFPLLPIGRSQVLLAGGVGITPVMTMAAALAATGRPFELHYAAKSRDHAAFLDELAETSFAAQVTFYASDEGKRMDLARILGPGEHGRHAYLCGPSRMIAAVQERATELGWAADHVHFEHFSNAVAADAPRDDFWVVVRSSGLRIKVGRDQSIAEALAAAGTPVSVSCGEGICGLCLTGVIEGTPDHRDRLLTDEERASGTCITPCCSRALSETLVLDL